MDLLKSLSDDQLALLGCVAALGVSGSLLYFSVYLGQAMRRLRPQRDAAVVRLPTPVPASEAAQRREKAA